MIRISSVIIECGLFFLLLSPAMADPGFRMDFSDQIPGQRPKGWASVWQKPVDDVIYVTNAGDPSNPGRRQMLIDRAHGEDHSYFRYLRSFKLEEMGAAQAVRVSFRFKVECASLHEAPFEIDFGPANRRIMTLSFCLRDWGPNVYLYPSTLRSWTENWEAKQNLGEFQRNQWHRIELLLPYGAGTPLKKGFGRLYSSSGVPGPVFEVPALIPVQGQTAVSIVPANKRKGAAIFLTDFVFEPASPDGLK